ncbi:MAG: hypothetical protein V1879_01115 [Pseudomonadota bacterium]
MDETAYRQKFTEMVECPCAFEKALLARCVACDQVLRLQIAEREALGCRDAASQARCVELHGQLRRSFSFALGMPHDAVLPHAQEMRVQCGGLMGLQQVLSGDPVVGNVDALLAQSLRQWGDMDEIPYSEVVHEAGLCYKGRHG